MRIDQLLPTFGPHDAIGNHAIQLRRALRAAGIDGEIYADAMVSGGRRDARPWDELGDVRPGERALLYHASTSTKRLDWLAAQAAAGVDVHVDYHNITPSSYFARWLPDAARGMDVARRQLSDLAPAVSLALADSGFNEAELLDAGYERTTTRYLLVDLEGFHRPPDPKAMSRRRRQRRGSGAEWLFVGRLAPNKCQHDVIAAFAVYRRTVDAGARLTLVGGGTAPRYLQALRKLVADLELGDSVEMADSIDFPTLLALYATSDVFVCLSEHEGFCVPIIEAMELGVPVVAYARAAVPETVGDAGVLLDDKDPLWVATAVELLLSDEVARSSAVLAGRARAGRFALSRTAPEFVEALTSAERVPPAPAAS